MDREVLILLVSMKLASTRRARAMCDLIKDYLNACYKEEETARTASLPTAHLAAEVSQCIEQTRSNGTPNQWNHISKSLKAGFRCKCT